MGSVCKVIENKTFLAICPQQSFGRMFTAALFASLCASLTFATVASACPSAAKSSAAEKPSSVKPSQAEVSAAQSETKSESAAQVSVPDESSRASLGVSVSDSETDEHRKLGRHGRVSMTRERTLRD